MATQVKGVVTAGALNRSQDEDDARLDNIELGPVPPSYTVATLPPAAQNTGRIVLCSNGNAGANCLAVSNGTAWLRVVFGAAVATI